MNKDDGSITVIHGGVEMGQGLHTKIAQVAAGELNVPLEFIRVTGNHTDAINNAPPRRPRRASTSTAARWPRPAAVCGERIEEFCAANEEDAGVADRIDDWRAAGSDAGRRSSSRPGSAGSA